VSEGPHRIIKLDIDADSLSAVSADAEHERRVAVFDLLAANSFALEGVEGPYHLQLSRIDNRLVFGVHDTDDELLRAVMLSITPLRKHIKDYFLICESYYDAIRQATPDKVEAVDMGRRAIHNEGSEVLQARLEGKITLDFDTARRLFTLICSLHRPR
jgi:uncharacterized protein (UPF0262 family)